MRKIKSITDYPFILHMMNYKMDNDYIDIAMREEAATVLKNAVNKAVDNHSIQFELSDLISDLNAQYENVGFLNGYLTAMEVLQGKVKQGGRHYGSND